MSETTAPLPLLAALADDVLLARVRAEGHLLPLPVAREVVSRGERLAPALAAIAQDDLLFEEEPAEGAVPVLATTAAARLLGAIASPAAVAPLLDALRYATRNDDDWVLDGASALFAATGSAAAGPVRRLLREVGDDEPWGLVLVDVLMGLVERDPALAPEVARDLAWARESLVGEFVKQMVELELGVLCGRGHRAAVLAALGLEERDLKGPRGRWLTRGEVAQAAAAALPVGALRPPPAPGDPLAFFSDEARAARVADFESRSEDDCDALDDDDGDDDDGVDADDDDSDPDDDDEMDAFASEHVHDGTCSHDDDHDEDDDEPVEPFVREAPKVGRNDPCPCGSGRKYKKCCLK